MKLTDLLILGKEISTKLIDLEAYLSLESERFQTLMKSIDSARSLTSKVSKMMEVSSIN